MGAYLEGSSHDTNVTSAIKSVIETSIGYLDQVLLDALAIQLGRIDKFSATELLGPLFLLVIDINDDDSTGLVLDGSLDD